VRGFDAPGRLIPTPVNAVHICETGGPKMRKWYGQESNSVPRDGGEQAEQVRRSSANPRGGGVAWQGCPCILAMLSCGMWCGVVGIVVGHMC
jgi:hypothetical protein